ncbi:MAG: hypothetical protein Q8R28_14260, partial [Dehalococcoidia bacterium]|nr:hypothetical protein [Dehalococcoidia bacterium]
DSCGRILAQAAYVEHVCRQEADVSSRGPEFATVSARPPFRLQAPPPLRSVPAACPRCGAEGAALYVDVVNLTDRDIVCAPCGWRKPLAKMRPA